MNNTHIRLIGYYDPVREKKLWTTGRKMAREILETERIVDIDDLIVMITVLLFGTEIFKSQIYWREKFWVAY